MYQTRIARYSSDDSPRDEPVHCIDLKMPQSAVRNWPIGKLRNCILVHKNRKFLPKLIWSTLCYYIIRLMGSWSHCLWWIAQNCICGGALSVAFDAAQHLTMITALNFVSMYGVKLGSYLSDHMCCAEEAEARQHIIFVCKHKWENFSEHITASGYYQKKKKIKKK